MKDTFREIKNSLGRFLSILLIVAAGVGFFVGVKATAPSMHKTAENYFNQQSLMDLEVLSTVGFSDEDAEKVRALDGVEKVMPAFSADLLCKSGDETLVTRLFSLPEDPESAINIPVLVAGRLPNSDDECVLVAMEGLNEFLPIGGKLTVEEPGLESEEDSSLAAYSYTIVGYVDLPQYFSYSFGSSSVGDGSVSLVALIPQSNFLFPRYTEMYLTLDCHAKGISAFDDSYSEILASISSELEAIGDVQYQAFVAESEKELEAAEAELAEGQKELDEAKEQLNDGKKQLEDGRKQLEDGWKEYEAGRSELQQGIAEAEEQIYDGKTQLSDGKKQLEDGWKEYKEALQEYEQAKQDLADGWAEYNAGLDEYNAALEQYNAGLETYNSSLESYNQYLEYYNMAAAALAEQETYINQLQDDQSYAVTSEEIAQITEALNQAKSELENNKSQLETLEPDSVDYMTTQMVIETLESEIAYQEETLARLSESGVATSDDVRAEYTHAQETMTTAGNKLAEAKTKLDEAEAELNSAKAELAEAEAQLTEAKEELTKYQEEYDSSKEEVERQLAEAKAELEAGEEEYKSGLAELQEAEAEYYAEREAAEQELQDAYEELTAGEKELAGYQKEYDEQLEEFNKMAPEAEKELSSGRNHIQNAKRDLHDIALGKWYIFTRNDVVESYSNFGDDAQRISKIADVFPVFFLMVAALVCLTTMSRMIDEQRTQLGTYKALGYHPREIISKYLTYATLACIGGCIVGPILCVNTLPRIIFGAYAVLYVLPDFTVSMPVTMLIISVIVALLCTVLVAYIACHKELKTTTAALMRPKAPKAGKKILLERIPFLWRRFSFFQKLTARNLFRYKIRLLMTVIGISGCMALVVAGFGLHDAIAPITERQYDEITPDDVELYLDGNYSYEEIKEEYAAIQADERLDSSVLVLLSECKASDSSEKNHVDECSIFLPQSIGEAEELIHLRNKKTKSPLSWSDEGVIITDKVARSLNVDIGDQLVLLANDEKHTVRVSGVTEFYIYNYVFFTPTYYEEIFGESPVYNTVYASESEKMVNRDAFSSEWLSKSGSVSMLFFTDGLQDVMDDTLNSMNIVVYVMIICAGILAFIVLYNLTNINLSERLREIATVKVLGFRHMETNMYIFRENIIMCVFGILLGSGLGYLLAQYMINTVEVSMVSFCREIRPLSFLLSAFITLVFAILVNLFMTKKIKDISMVESLKAIE